ncbi:helix-turn-helix domain-containing protein [Microbispora sp. CSR-4]|uniref:winged helix-turn-helix transcriptional regulator n=1 Tax=Microbispora sp. CSR-4 TaxID=2592813 RepID=UPI002905A17F|nr:helix-turn-helix domain-containing protein [Microbispora sp. CSR-4]
MTRSRAEDPNVCGVTAAIAVIDGKWKTILLWLLESAPRRPGELLRRLPGLTEKVLTQTLREMESDGLVHREVYDGRPLKTVYSLTDFGRDLSEALAPLSDWGHRRLEKLARETPSGKATSGLTPSGNATSGLTPSGNATSGETSAGEIPPGEVPSGEGPSGEVPSGDWPSGKTEAQAGPLPVS